MLVLVPSRVKPLMILFQELSLLVNKTQIMIGPKRMMNMTHNIPFIIPATKGEEDHFVHHKGEEEETKQEHPVAMDILVVQIYTTTSTYRKPRIVLFVLKEIHEYDSPRLFGKSTNHTNSY